MTDTIFTITPASVVCHMAFPDHTHWIMAETGWQQKAIRRLFK